MASSQMIRRRLMYLGDQNIFQFSILVGNNWIDAISRFDVSNPDYAKFESYFCQMKYGARERSIDAMCHICPYDRISAIVLQKINAAGQTQYGDDLTIDVSATSVPVPKAVGLTFRSILQGMSTLPNDQKNGFIISIGTNVFEEVPKYSVADADVLTAVIGWYNIDRGRMSMSKLTLAYDGIDMISVRPEVYRTLSAGSDCTPDKHKLILPWE